MPGRALGSKGTGDNGACPLGKKGASSAAPAPEIW